LEPVADEVGQGSTSTMTTLEPTPAADLPQPPGEVNALPRRPLPGAVALACGCSALLMPVVGWIILVIARRAETLQRVCSVVFPLLMLGLAIAALVLWRLRVRAERADPSLDRSRAVRAGAIVAGLALLAWPVVAYFAVIIFVLIGWRC
jgi:hypothetical protein